jgi:hypothetical protein
MVKLYIELVLTDFIVKVVRSSFVPDCARNGSDESSNQNGPRSATMVAFEDPHPGDIAFQTPQYEDIPRSITTSDLSHIWTSVQRGDDAARVASPSSHMKKNSAIRLDYIISRESSAEVLPQMEPVFVRRYSGNWI